MATFSLNSTGNNSTPVFPADRYRTRLLNSTSFQPSPSSSNDSASGLSQQDLLSTFQDLNQQIKSLKKAITQLKSQQGATETSTTGSQGIFPSGSGANPTDFSTVDFSKLLGLGNYGFSGAPGGSDSQQTTNSTGDDSLNNTDQNTPVASTDSTQQTNSTGDDPNNVDNTPVASTDSTQQTSSTGDDPNNVDNTPVASTDSTQQTSSTGDDPNNVDNTSVASTEDSQQTTNSSPTPAAAPIPISSPTPPTQQTKTQPNSAPPEAETAQQTQFTSFSDLTTFLKKHPEAPNITLPANKQNTPIASIQLKMDGDKVAGYRIMFKDNTLLDALKGKDQSGKTSTVLALRDNQGKPSSLTAFSSDGTKTTDMKKIQQNNADQLKSFNAAFSDSASEKTG